MNSLLSSKGSLEGSQISWRKILLFGFIFKRLKKYAFLRTKSVWRSTSFFLYFSVLLSGSLHLKSGLGFSFEILSTNYNGPLQADRSGLLPHSASFLDSYFFFFSVRIKRRTEKLFSVIHKTLKCYRAYLSHRFVYYSVLKLFSLRKHETEISKTTLWKKEVFSVFPFRIREIQH